MPFAPVNQTSSPVLAGASVRPREVLPPGGHTGPEPQHPGAVPVAIAAPLAVGATTPIAISIAVTAPAATPPDASPGTSAVRA